MSEKLTPWFSGDVKPARSGVYVRDLGFAVLYAMWNDAAWLDGRRSAEDTRYVTTVSAYQNAPWRGLAHDPNGEPKRPGDDLRFVLAQLAILEDGLTDEDVIWPMRVSFTLQAVKKRGLKIEP